MPRSPSVRPVSLCGLAAATMFALPAAAQELSVPIHRVTSDGIGPQIGIVHAMDGPDGLVLQAELGPMLSPGPHGFHLHQNPDCGPAPDDDGTMVPGLAAGGHFDPEDTGRHRGPSGDGHLGDLPALWVVEGEAVSQFMTAPRLTVDDLHGHSLVIHQNGDNYRDEPDALGGGGPRVACGVVPDA
jgi:Cu-Zn family superoxide dismutase